MSQDKPVPCPFCGGEEIYLEGDSQSASCACGDCLAEGPRNGFTDDEAIRAWNRRVSQDRRDAERYRWLRATTPYRFKKIQDAAIADTGDTLYLLGDKFDAAIDAELDRKGEEG